VESLSSAVRQVEMERNEVQSQLRESQALSQALRDKLENIRHDLASQGLTQYSSIRVSLMIKTDIMQFNSLMHTVAIWVQP